MIEGEDLYRFLYEAHAALRPEGRRGGPERMRALGFDPNTIKEMAKRLTARKQLAEEDFWLHWATGFEWGLAAGFALAHRQSGESGMMDSSDAPVPEEGARGDTEPGS